MRERKKQGAPQSALPTRNWRRRLVLGTLWLGVAAGAYFWGRNGTLSLAVAEPPAARQRVEDAPPRESIRDALWPTSMTRSPLPARSWAST